MFLNKIKNKLEEIKYAMTIPYGSDESWDKVSDDNFLKLLDIIQLLLYVIIFSTPVLSISVLIFQYIESIYEK